MEMEENVTEQASRGGYVDYERSIPVRYEHDVAVVGGGMAGVCAGCAAAASGASVVLIERFAVAGGVLTTGGVANFSGDPRGGGEVLDEIRSELKRYHALGPLRDSPHNTKEQRFDHEVLALVLQEILLSRGVKLLLHTRFVDAVARDGKISELIVCGQSGPEAVRAPVFIDCTGEAQVAHAAGCETMKGRESDGKPLAMSMMGFVRCVEPEELNDPDRRYSWRDTFIEYSPYQIPEGAFGPIGSEDDLPPVSIWPNGPRSLALKIWVAGGYDSTDTESITGAEIRGRRELAHVLDYYQRVEKRPWILDHCSPIIGIREGRRVVGDYVLSVEDVRAGREFPDGVARGTWYLDVHSPDDTHPVNRDERGVPPYQIPLRSLIVRDGQNVLMAGRCLSADSLAQSSARVSPTGAMMGQAAGIAAALAAREGKTIRQVDPQKVRAVVLERGGILTCGAE